MTVNTIVSSNYVNPCDRTSWTQPQHNENGQ